MGRVCYAEGVDLRFCPGVGWSNVHSVGMHDSEGLHETMRDLLPLLLVSTGDTLNFPTQNRTGGAHPPELSTIAMCRGWTAFFWAEDTANFSRMVSKEF